MQDVVVLTILLEDMTPLSLCSGTFVETGGHTSDSVAVQMICIAHGRLVSSFSSLVFFSPSHLPGRIRYYFRVKWVEMSAQEIAPTSQTK